MGRVPDIRALQLDGDPLGGVGSDRTRMGMIFRLSLRQVWSIRDGSGRYVIARPLTIRVSTARRPRPEHGLCGSRTKIGDAGKVGGLSCFFLHRRSRLSQLQSRREAFTMYDVSVFVCLTVLERDGSATYPAKTNRAGGIWTGGLHGGLLTCSSKSSCTGNRMPGVGMTARCVI